MSDQTPSSPAESTATASGVGAIPQQRSEAEPVFRFAEVPTVPVAFEAPAAADAPASEPPAAPAPVAAPPPVAAPSPIAEPVATPSVATPSPIATPSVAAPPPVAEPEAAPEGPLPPVENPVGLAAEQRRKRSGVVAGAIIAVVVIVLLSAIGYLVYQRFYADGTRDAVAGNCLADLPVVAIGEDKAVDQARIVDCDDPAASYVVLGRVAGLTPEQARDVQVCRPFRGSTFIYRPSRPGYVLCLSKIEE